MDTRFGIDAMEPPAGDIRPPQSLRMPVPDGRFAGLVPGRKQQFSL
ncbi:hypothetical protein [Rhizobium binxianense]